VVTKTQWSGCVKIAFPIPATGPGQATRKANQHARTFFRRKKRKVSPGAESPLPTVGGVKTRKSFPIDPKKMKEYVATTSIHGHAGKVPLKSIPSAAPKYGKTEKPRKGEVAHAAS